MKKLSQKEKIKRHLLSGKSLTQMQALKKFGCFRLAARVSNIKDEEIKIETEMIYDKKTKKNYAKYFIK